MRWSGIWLLALIATVIVLDGNWVRAAPSRRSEMMLKALKELEDLEQKYSSVARPRFGKRAEVENNFPAAQDYDSQKPNISPVLWQLIRKSIRNEPDLPVSESEWRVGRLASYPEMRNIRRVAVPPEFSGPVDNHTDFI